MEIGTIFVVMLVDIVLFSFLVLYICLHIAQLVFQLLTTSRYVLMCQKICFM